MAELEAGKKEQAVTPTERGVEETSERGGEKVFRMDFNGHTIWVRILLPTPVAFIGDEVVHVPYKEGEGVDNAPPHLVVTRNTYQVLTPQKFLDVGETLLLGEIGQTVDEEREIQEWLADIDRSIERMRRDQSEIDRLKEETRAAIARLNAA